MAANDASQQLDEAAFDLELMAAEPSPEVTEAHRALDNIENRLELLRSRQQALAERQNPSKKGRVEQLDLRTIISLEDKEELFDRVEPRTSSH